MNDWAETMQWLWAPISALTAWAVWSMKRATISRGEVQAIEKKLDDYAHRLDKVESKVESLPTKDDLHTLDKHLVQLNETVKGWAQGQKNQAAAIKRIEEFLMRKKT